MDILCCIFFLLIFTICKSAAPHVEDPLISSDDPERANFQQQRTFVSSHNGRNRPFRIPDTNERTNRNTSKSLRKRFDKDRLYENIPTKVSKSDNFWFSKPYDTYSMINESLRKIDHSMTWPGWSSSKKDIYNNKNRKNHRKHPIDPFEDYLGLDSKLHELMSDRKYIHEHEGFFFPIPVPSNHHHHEKEDHHILIPLLLLILIPLLLFAIIIPLNANLLSTLFLIMQNNGATATAAQLATGRRKKRYLYTEYHPVIEEKVVEMLIIIDKIIEEFENAK